MTWHEWWKFWTLILLGVGTIGSALIVRPENWIPLALCGVLAILGAMVGWTSTEWLARKTRQMRGDE